MKNSYEHKRDVFIEVDDEKGMKYKDIGNQELYFDILSLKCISDIQVKMSNKWLGVDMKMRGNLRVNIEIVFKTIGMDKVI